MGLDKGRFELNSPNGAYYPGQTVQGKLIFQQDKVKSFRGLYVKLKGFCYVQWTTRRHRTVNGKRESYTVNHSAHEEYINYKVYLVGGESGEHSIGPGNHEYPFQFRLPDNCPASFEGQHGHIRYEIKAVVDKSLNSEQEKKIAVRVVVPLDLNLDSYCKEPIELQLEETYSCCCFRSGVSDVSVKLPVAGYCPGQTIPIELVCSNKGNVEIDDIKLCITKKLIYIGTSARKTDKENARVTCGETLAEIKKGPIPGNTNRNWTVDMEVPAIDVYDLSGCEYIKLDYNFQVVINPKGCHSDTKDSRRLVIGTVPLVGFQDNVPNPLRDQFPLPSTMIDVYPGGNPPFPNPQTYPGPYHPANPYLDGNQPYSPTSSPYPPNSSPLPSANPPYPDVTPYRDNPPPYPGNLTDPGSNTSYPAENDDEKSPFLGVNSTNPGANPNYSGTDPQNEPNETKSNPSPGNIGGSQTANFGFTVPSGGSGVNVPLLERNNSASPRPASAYAAASAPALNSPDSALPEKKD